MMRATDGDRVFVADLSSERAGLGESKMMRVGRRAAAHDARLAGYESGVLLVVQAIGLARDSAADGADFLGDLCKGADAVSDVEARIRLGSDLAGFSRRLLRFLAANASSLTVKRLSTSCPSGFVSRFLSGIRR